MTRFESGRIARACGARGGKSLRVGRVVACAALALAACDPGHVLDKDALGSQPSSQLASAEGAAGTPLTAAGAGRPALELEMEMAGEANQPRVAAAAGAPALAMEVTRADAGSDARPASPLAQRVFGVTIDDVTPLYDISEALAGLAKKPTTRVIFDPLRAPTSYSTVLRRLSEVSYVMGGLLDSVAVSEFPAEVYEARAAAYVDQVGDLVDIWEIGIEVNGEWLGKAGDVATKIDRAYTQVASRGKRSALTLYYNEGCVQRAENEMFSWAKTHVSEAMKRGLDYVFITYYEERCHQPEPDWKQVFTRLREIFPHAKLGFGGCGTTDEARKAEVLQHFYGLQVDVPGYVGGYFWWYFRQDMQPAASKPLWNLLNQGLETAPL